MKKKDKKDFDDSLKILAKSSLIVFIGVALSKVLAYTYRIIVARHFGPEVYGLLALALMVVGWFGAFASLGLTQGLLRFIPLYRGKKEYAKIKHILKISLITVFITGVLSSILMFTLAEYISVNLLHNEGLTIFLKIFSLMIPFSMFSNIYLSVIQAFEKVSWYSFLQNIFQNALRVITLGLLIFLGFSENSIPLSYLLTIFGLLLAGYLVFKYKISKIFDNIKVENKEKIVSDLISYSWPVMFYTIAASLHSWIDTFFIGYFTDATQVGFYNAAIPIVMLLTFVSQLFFQLFFPLITREYGDNKLKVVRELSKQVNKWIVVVNIPVFILMFIFPGVLINLLFGAEYLAAENALKILAVGMFIFSIFSISNILISMIGKSKMILFNIISTSALNIILNILLVPQYGITGAAVATSLTLVAHSVLLFVETRRYVSIIPLRRKMIKAFLVAMIPTAIVLLIREMIEVSVLVITFSAIFFVVVYTILIFKTGCLDKKDKMILNAVRRKIFRPFKSITG